jgi:hypothetical protein
VVRFRAEAGAETHHALAEAMSETGVAIHEEAVIDDLLEDLGPPR